jgi:hypothetical protein
MEQMKMRRNMNFDDVFQGTQEEAQAIYKNATNEDIPSDRQLSGEELFILCRYLDHAIPCGLNKYQFMDDKTYHLSCDSLRKKLATIGLAAAS